MLLRFFCALIITLFWQPSIAQDTISALEEVTVQADRLQKYGVGIKVQTIETATLRSFANTNLSEILIQQSSVFIKNYGPENLATIGLRGTGASQTAVLWNGINLQSAMLGQLDFALLPSNFIDEVKIQYGGASALYGSGAMGGAIHLNNKPVYNQGFQAKYNASVGSFQNHQQNISLGFGNKNWVSNIRLFYKNAANNFPYKDNENRISQQTNSEIIQYGVLQENFLKLKKNQELNLLIWYQYADRNIPPAIGSTTSRAKQIDGTWRVSSQWKRQGAKMDWAARVALLTEMLNYTENIFSKTDAIGTVAELESQVKISKNQVLNIGVNNTWQQVKSNNYSSTQHLHRSSIFTNYRLENTRRTMLASLSLRKEFISINSHVPITPSLGLEAKIWKRLSVSGNISRNYRVPTLNDLYWNDASAVGNPNLQPESGWTSDVGVAVNFPINKTATSSSTQVSFSSNFFNSNIKNWILWKPNTSGRWSPENILEVWSRGIETKTGIEQSIKQWKFKINVQTSYVVSTNEKAKSSTDESYKMQLIYVPIYNHQANISAAFKGFNINYNQTYTGYSFTTSDNTKALPPYSLGNAQVSYESILKKFALKIFLQANNIWASSYQVVQNYAMPLRHFQVGVSINFNKKLS